MNLKPWILWTLMAQALFFSAWAGVEEWQNRAGEMKHGEFLLETRVIDPRDLLTGNYLNLPLAIADVSGFLPQQGDDGLDTAVHLGMSGSVTFKGASAPVYTVLGAAHPAPSPLPVESDGSVWVLASGSPKSLVYGVERFYFNEDRADEFRFYHGDRYWVRVLALPDGHLRLNDVVKLRTP
jgi:uncharacterized membrane-anchored protein